MVKIMTSAKLRHLVNLTYHGGSKFNLIQLILADYLANKTITSTRCVVGDNCKYEPLSLPISMIPKDHAPLYQLQLGHYGQL